MATSIQTSRPAALRSFSALIRSFGLGLQARAQRRALADLDPHLLADLGISRDQALAEALRPVWDVPASWRR